jgi:hypothetical protein
MAIDPAEPDRRHMLVREEFHVIEPERITSANGC